VSLSAQINAFAEKSLERVEHIRRGFCLKLFGAIVKDTPVLTGRLRGNWQTNAGSPKVGELPLRTPDAVMGEVRTVIDSVHGDVPIFFTNNLPYAARIEYDGWSHTKSPEGMVRRNVARVLRLVNEAVREGRL
jgi:hypothetical protein